MQALGGQTLGFPQLLLCAPSTSGSSIPIPVERFSGNWLPVFKTAWFCPKFDQAISVKINYWKYFTVHSSLLSKCSPPAIRFSSILDKANVKPCAHAGSHCHIVWCWCETSVFNWIMDDFKFNFLVGVSTSSYIGIKKCYYAISSFW